MEPASHFIQAIKHLPYALYDDVRAIANSDVVTFQRHRVGELRVTTGIVVACDPALVEFELKPFATHVPSGWYPVVLSIVQFETGIARVAFATLQLDEQQPERWEAATFMGDSDPPGYDTLPAYGVDTGNGCFMDIEAARIIQQRLRIEPNYLATIDDAMGNNYVDNWSWANLTLEPETSANVITFSAGAGDGAYVTYIGYNLNDDAVCLTTDFQLF